jgi:hypothetical protein
MEKTNIEVIMVEPGKEAVMMSLGDDLESMQRAVGGLIEEYMPYEDDIAIICNEEGKINGLPPNRAITDENGRVMDIIAGPFFMAYAPIESERFLSMPEDLKEKYMAKVKDPQKFRMTMNGIKILPNEPEKQEMER